MSRRLIDANELTPKAYESGDWGHPKVVDLVDIEYAPTIDAVQLPCKIGDKVWIARQYKCHKRPRWGIVSEMFFTDDMELCIVVKGVARGKWGVDVFATYEEALAEIERRDENGMS